MSELEKELVLKVFANHSPCMKRRNRKIKSRFSEKSITLDVSLDADGFLTLRDRIISNEAISFLYELQEAEERLLHTNYGINQEEIDVSPQLVANSKSEKIIIPASKKVVLRPKNKTPAEPLKKEKLLENEQSQEGTEAETIPARTWKNVLKPINLGSRAFFEKDQLHVATWQISNKKLNSHGKSRDFFWGKVFIQFINRFVTNFGAFKVLLRMLMKYDLSMLLIMRSSPDTRTVSSTY